MSNPAARVKKTCMYLDGLAIEIEFEHSEVGELLDFLLADMQPEGSDRKRLIARFCFSKNQNEWMLSRNDGEYVINQRELNDLALPLFNASMQSFAKHNSRSISLHAALVSDKSGSILMPGAPGSGKSNACLWLNHLGMRYHSDEFVTVNRQNGSLHALTRPYTLRKDALKRLRKLLDLPSNSRQTGRRMLETSGNAYIDHRLVNPHFQPDIPALKSILFPVFTTGDQCQLVEISRARVGMELMRAHFQSESFADHGFASISTLVRDVPAYLMVYNRFEQIAELLDGQLETP